MKKIIIALFAVALVGLASAQFIAGPTPYSVVTNTAVWRVTGNTVSNIPTAMARPIKIGPLGFGLSATFGTTNAITNGTFLVFEWIADIYGTNPVTWGNGGVQTNTFLAPIIGTAPFYYWTNVNPQLALYTQLGNLPYIRLKSVNPTNDPASVFITNMHIWTR